MSANERFSRFKVQGPRAIALVVAVGSVFAPLGCSCDGDGGTEKNTGEFELILSRPNRDAAPFDYTGSSNSAPAGALISSVTNVSTNTAVTGVTGVKLFPIVHTDTNGAPAGSAGTTSTCLLGELEPQASTSAFDNKPANGGWTARASCTSAALLDEEPRPPAVPAHNALKLVWHK
jgi:hypothetical protein